MATPLVPNPIRGKYFWRSDERVRLCAVVILIDMTVLGRCLSILLTSDVNVSFYCGESCNYQEPTTNDAPVDPIADDRLSKLKQIVPSLSDLGINTFYFCQSGWMMHHLPSESVLTFYRQYRSLEIA